MVFFQNSYIQIYKLVDDDAETNDFQESEQVLVPLTYSLHANIQTGKPEEVKDQFGKVLQDVYTVYTDFNLNMPETDLYVRSNNRWFEIIGGVVHVDGWVELRYTKFFVKRLRKTFDYPIKLNERLQDYLYRKFYNNDEIDYGYAMDYFAGL